MIMLDPTYYYLPKNNVSQCVKKNSQAVRAFLQIAHIWTVTFLLSRHQDRESRY